MTELLPCPFCGSEARIFELTWTDGLGVPHDFKHPYYRVVCQGGCRTLKGDYDTEAEAIAAWNSRAERTCEMDTDWEYLTNDIPDAPEDTWAYKCGACDWSFRYDRGIRPSYCPNCGARVEVGE